MPIREDKVRVQIIIAKSMKDRVEMYSEKMGISKSALCGILVGQGIMAYDKAYEMIDNVQLDLTKVPELHGLFEDASKLK